MMTTMFKVMGLSVLALALALGCDTANTPIKDATIGQDGGRDVTAVETTPLGETCTAAGAEECTAGGQKRTCKGGSNGMLTWTAFSDCTYKGCQTKCDRTCPVGTLDSGLACEKCDPGDPCCSGNRCWAGGRCVSGMCEPCGNTDQICCESGTALPACFFNKSCVVGGARSEGQCK